MWYITEFAMFEYRVKFANPGMAEKFSSLVNLLGSPSGTESDGISAQVAVNDLRDHVLKLAGRQYDDDEESAFAEIDIETSSFALLDGST